MDINNNLPDDTSLVNYAMNADEVESMGGLGINDASVEVEISADNMQAVISQYRPPIASGAKLTIPVVMTCLLKNNVIHGLLRSGLVEIFRNLKSGKSIEGIVIARGTAPTAAESAHLMVVGDLDYPVYPGDHIAIITEGKPYMPGKGVTGEIIEDFSLPTVYTNEIDVKVGEGCFLNYTDQVIEAQHYGLASVSGNKITLERLTQVSKDSMALTIDVYPRDSLNRRTEVSRLRSSLLPLRLGLPFLPDVLAKAVEESISGNKVITSEAIVKGRDPVAGKDGRLQFNELELVDISQNIKAQRDKKGAQIFLVQEGQLIAHMLAPDVGVEGMDIFGRKIPVAKGRDIFFIAGEGVRANHITNSFYAEKKGVVIIEDNVVSVCSLQLVRENFDSTVTFCDSESCLVVNGAIVCGAQVDQVKHLVVRAGVEDVALEASGDIDLSGGVSMDPRGKRVVRCRNIQARYLNNARVIARGDVTVRNEITNSVVEANGTVEVTSGKGLIRGGYIKAAKGIHALEVGSPMCTDTYIKIGFTDSYKDDLDVYIMELETEKGIIADYLSKLDIIQNGSNSQEAEMVSLLKQRIRLRQSLSSIDERISQIKSGVFRYHPELWVKGTIHTGTVIEFYKHKYEVKSDISGSRFEYCLKKHRILRHPINYALGL